ADVYLSTDTAVASPLTPALLADIARLPDVAELSTSRRLQLPTASGPLQLWALTLEPRGWAGFELLAGEPAAAYAGFRQGGVLVSEPFAYRRGLEVGDALPLPTREGERDFPVVGI